MSANNAKTDEKVWHTRLELSTNYHRALRVLAANNNTSMMTMARRIVEERLDWEEESKA